MSKLICPYCQNVKNIGQKSPFLIFQCTTCGKLFRGIHADLKTSAYFWRWLNTTWSHLSYLNNPYDWESWCPWCGGTIMIYKNKGTGFHAAQCCCHCGRDLPQDRARQRGDWNVLIQELDLV